LAPHANREPGASKPYPPTSPLENPPSSSKIKEGPKPIREWEEDVLNEALAMFKDLKDKQAHRN
jgi:hypothetical protein